MYFSHADTVVPRRKNEKGVHHFKLARIGGPRYDLLRAWADTGDSHRAHTAKAKSKSDVST